MQFLLTASGACAGEVEAETGLVDGEVGTEPNEKVSTGVHSTCADFTADTHSCRQPSLTMMDVWRTESVILRRQLPDKLLTYIVCPGLLYGAIHIPEIILLPGEQYIEQYIEQYMNQCV